MGRRIGGLAAARDCDTTFAPDDSPATTVTGAVAGGDTVALEVTWNGTHTGPLTTAEGTIPASGKRQETPAAFVFVFVFVGDKIKASRHYFDSLTLLKQIGAQPS